MLLNPKTLILNIYIGSRWGNMNKLQERITKVSSTMIFVATIFTGSQVLAAPATLNGVEISASNSRGYDIVLNTDNKTNIQKKSATSDTLILDLKNTKVSKDTNTVYKNADGIEHVILKPTANNLQIEINGKSAGSSTVALNSEIASLPQDYNNTVFLNKPLNAYAPIHEIEQESQAATGVSLLSRILNSPTLRNILTSNNFGWAVSFVLMFGFLIMTSRKNQSRSQVNVKIQNDDLDNKILKAALDRKEGLITEGQGTRRTQLRPKPQDSLSAQQTNYGLKAYNKPLGANTNSFKAEPSAMPSDLLGAATGAYRKPLRATSTATAQELKEDIKRNEVHIDNVKFLESMAKIYERSGRVDLATGLANNIRKAKNIR